MCRALLFVTLVVFSLVFQAASFQCPVQRSNTTDIFDLGKLDSLSKLPNITKIFDPPVTCVTENDPVCNTTICCDGDEICCYLDDPTDLVKQCGCRKPGQKCHQAPLVYIGNSLCGPFEDIRISACLMHNPENFEIPSIAENSNPQAESEIKDNVVRGEEPVPGIKVLTVRTFFSRSRNYNEAYGYLQQFTANQLVDMLPRAVIKQMCQNLEERESKG